MPTVARRITQPAEAALARLRHKRRPPTAKERLLSAFERLRLKAGEYVRRRGAPQEDD